MKNLILMGFKKISISCFFIVIGLAKCTNGNAVGQQKLLASDYRIFQGTIAWGLAKAIHDEDTDAIKQIASKNKQLVSFVDPEYGQTLLGLAVYNVKYNSCKTLVELGADPNAFNNFDGSTPLMEAADLGYNGNELDSRFLVLLLKHGANPNIQQKYLERSGSHGRTSLSIACTHGTLVYVKILINAGADINYKNDPSRGTLLQAAMLSENPDLVLYLIQHGADYHQPTWILDDHKKIYITDDLRDWKFDLGSEKYKKKMQIVKFLKEHGMDYRKAKIPSYYYDSYDKDYLDKY